MIHLKTKAARLAAVVGFAVTLGLSTLALAVPAHAGTVPSGTATRSHAIAPFEHLLGGFEAVPITGDPGQFTIQNYAAPHDCLGIQGGSTTPGADAVLWNCNGHPDQEWGPGPYTDDGYFDLENDDFMCLGVGGGSTKEGTSLVIWNCLDSSHPDQFWDVGTLYPPSGTVCDGLNVWQNLKSKYVIGTKGGSLAEGTDIVQWNYQNSCNNQIWF
ncbi:MAG: RICIN domain-containing protein [Streptosporangiaceae bacterium]|jgi:hypothetical protein